VNVGTLELSIEKCIEAFDNIV